MRTLRRDRRDPFWDLEGTGARRRRRRRRVVGNLAFVIAIVACGLVTAAWLRVVGPALALPIPT